MKLKRKIICLFAALCMITALLPAAFADGEDDERFKDKTWDEVIDQFLTEHNIDPEDVALGYRNTVTGEEHFLNGDT